MKYHYQLLIWHVLFHNVVISITSESEKKKTNYVLYEITPEAEEQLNILKAMSREHYYEFLIQPKTVNEYVTVVVGDEKANDFEEVLTEHGISWHIIHLESLNSPDGQKVNHYTKNNPSSYTWDGYYDLDDINEFVHDLAAAYPDVATIVAISKSVEGKTIEGIKISYGKEISKKIIFLECGFHAREWLTPSFCTFMANEILTTEDVETRIYAEEFEWIILPVGNPDGYSWTFSQNRLWRKNRKDISNGIFGVDLNRNFDIGWMVYDADIDFQSSIYAGSMAFSEPETKFYADYLETIADRLELYLSFHTFGQLLLIPYGYTDKNPDNYNDLKIIGDKVVAALAERFGTQYAVGPLSDIIHKVSGTSFDFVKSKLDIPLAYCYEMRDKQKYGFLLPADQIIPNHLEVKDSIVAMIREAKKLGYLNGVTSAEVLKTKRAFDGFGNNAYFMANLV